MEQENYGAEQEQELETAACPEAVTEEVTQSVETGEAPAEETAEEVPETEQTPEMLPAEASEETAEEAAAAPKKEKKPLKLWHMILAGVGCAVLLIALAVVLLYELGFEIAPKAPAADDDAAGSAAFAAANDYTADDDSVVKKAADKVVATVGDKELTNGKLQVYYSIIVKDYLMSYYSYLSQVGLDYTQPLNEQQCYYDESLSWEEYFVDAAVKTWINYQSVALLAEESGYQLSAESRKSLDELYTELDAQAETSGYEDVEALLAGELNCTYEDYLDYWTLYEIGVGFTGQEPDAATLAQYFEENKETYEANGITKDSGPIVDVRHILIEPEGTTDEDGNTTYSDKAWKACKKEAEALLNQWKTGEATEDSFADLANEKSADGGSNTTGGLYEGITQDSSYVEPFLNWCMDETHKVGDTGIVKTDYGYHIMYLSATEEYWAYAATQDYIDEQTSQIIEDATNKWSAETDTGKICLAEVKFY